MVSETSLYFSILTSRKDCSNLFTPVLTGPKSSSKQEVYFLINQGASVDEDLYLYGTVPGYDATGEFYSCWSQQYFHFAVAYTTVMLM